MKYDENKQLTEHKVGQVMSSRPRSLGKSGHKTVWQLASEQPKCKAKVTKRYSGNDSVFMGC